MKSNMFAWLCATVITASPLGLSVAADIASESVPSTVVQDTSSTVAGTNRLTGNAMNIASGIVNSVEKGQRSDAILGITNLTTVYGDGQMVSAIAIEYPSKVKQLALSQETYAIAGKEIEAVYVNDDPQVSDKHNKKSGKYVIVEFKHTNSVPFTLTQKPRNNEGESAQKNDGPKDASMRSDRQLPNLSTQVEQLAPILAKNGVIYGPTQGAISNTTVAPSIIDEFKTYHYTDESIGATMPYNIYLPKNYDPNKTYPLYVFIGDASTNINNDKAVLFQGNGATIFATSEEQTKHEAIILAPQYTQDLVDQLGMMTTDENKWTTGLQLVTNLINHVIDTYPVDTNRIYGSGQSQGGMANIAISDRYPSLFTAQFLVACQWNTDEMKALKDKKLWILVSEGDTKAYPAMNIATKNWEELGTKVARSNMWNSYSTPTEFNALVKATEAQKARINYSVFEGGSHMYTWSVAYTIEGIRDWLFSQTKAE